MDVKRLRAETAADHERVEGLVPLMQPQLTMAEYRRVLGRFLGFVQGWERWAAECAPRELQAMVALRRRADLLERDLRFCGGDGRGIADASFAQSPVSKARFLGMMYVLEGSMLGGQYIANHVEQVFGFRRGEGDAYFAGAGAQTGSLWRDFVALLTALPEADADEVIGAAKEMFAKFGEWIAQGDAEAAAEVRVEHG